MATALANLAGAAARDLLAGAAAVWRWAEISPSDPVAAAAEAAALTFIGDAGEDRAPPYILLTVKAGPATEVAAGVRMRQYVIDAECVRADPAGATPEDDLIAGLDIEGVVEHCWDQHHAGEIDFELVSVETDLPVRDESTGVGANEILNRLVITLEAYDDA